MRLLGAGGMGQVYLGEHVVLGQPCAIKILDARLMQHPQIVTRFVNEAKAAAKLTHPNLIRVHDISQVPNGPWYMALEYLEGETLGRFIASRGAPVAPHLIVHILAPVASCMLHAHTRGAVHRDLKPENIFLVQRGRNPHFPVVLDLGVAQLSEELAVGPGTKTGTVIGTPIYMAPEQLRGERVTPAADVYALAVIAYEMATGGWFPYQQHESRAQYIELAPPELYFRQRTTPPLDPRSRFAGMSEAFANVILGALDPDPTERPATIGAFVQMLAEATPTNGVDPDGLAIVREVAEDLLHRDNMLETIRAPRAPAEIASTSGAHSRYRVVEKLGAGGMAEVFLAVNVGEEGFERTVAIKRVLAGMSSVPEFANMFIAEARLASKLSHPNIVPVLDFSKDAEGRLFLAMEYVHGRDLAALLDAGPLAPSLIIYIVTEMLRGLGYAHDVSDPNSTARGLIHRDVSPQNVLLGYEGAVKVSDFGLAKALSASGNARTDTPRGKASYMSPEQANGDPLDPRSDLWAVGVMLWEMLANRSLFDGTPRECIAQVLFKEIPRPSAIRSRVPADLEAITMRLLTRELDQRYPTAEAVIDDLLRCEDAPRDGRGELVRLLGERFPDARIRSRSSGAGASGSPRGLVAQQIAVPAPLSTLGGAASQSLPRVGSKRRTGMRAIIAALILAAAAVVLYTSTRSSKNGEPVASAPTVVPADSTIVIVDTQPLPDAAEQAVMLDAEPTVATLQEAPTDAGPRLRPTPNRPTLQEPVQKGTGELAILVKPWAEIWIDGKEVGQTPFREKVPAGRHRVRLKNEDAGKDETIVITVTPDQTTTVQRTW
ncbi:MAG: serine/threonine protein kinase [Deltaproteobacteria bacterium]|nr:serine/threonine protein kinase [Deltaproteobacteria bacterium]